MKSADKRMQLSVWIECFSEMLDAAKVHERNRDSEPVSSAMVSGTASCPQLYFLAGGFADGAGEQQWAAGEAGDRTNSVR